MPAASARRREAAGVRLASELAALPPVPHLALVPAPVVTAVQLSPPLASLRQAFCERIKATRESRGISLSAIAQSTKIGASHLAALERGDLSHWPEGIYRRSFFRGYAAAAGLPVESTVDEFIRLFAEPETATSTPPTASDAPVLRLKLARGWFQRVLRDAAGPSMLDGAVILVLVSALVWWTPVDIWTGAGMIALCHYPHIARAIRQRLAIRRLRRT
jgi:transcriptional regulator with XRE-family HTH domain